MTLINLVLQNSILLYSTFHLFDNGIQFIFSNIVPSCLIQSCLKRVEDNFSKFWLGNIWICNPKFLIPSCLLWLDQLHFELCVFLPLAECVLSQPSKVLPGSFEFVFVIANSLARYHLLGFVHHSTDYEETRLRSLDQLVALLTFRKTS